MKRKIGGDETTGQITVVGGDEVDNIVGGDEVAPAIAGGDEVDAIFGGDEFSASDVRLKADISHVGTTVLGLPLYQFRYLDGTQRYEGVMAQDVIEKMPDAVILGDDGYYRVNYGRLGLKMRQVQAS